MLVVIDNKKTLNALVVCVCVFACLIGSRVSGGMKVTPTMDRWTENKEVIFAFQ